jgi:hypothetical protein
MTTRVWKISDRDCPICAEMSGFDRSETHSKGLYYRDLDLSDLEYNQDLRDYIKDNIVSEDNTIDIPIYVVEWRTIFIGWMQGRHTRGEFKKKIIEILAKRKG